MTLSADELKELRAGDWIVAKTAWTYEALAVKKVTPGRVTAEGRGQGDRFIRPAEVVFVGTEGAAEGLVEQLHALKERHRKAAAQLQEQHNARVEATLSKAKGSAG